MICKLEIFTKPWTMEIRRSVPCKVLILEIETPHGLGIPDTFLCVVHLHDLHCTIFLNESSKDL